MLPKILLVEDNESDVALTQLALKQACIQNEVVVVRDGEEALDYLFAKGAYSDRNQQDRPQVVMLDLNLPKIDGLDVLKAVRENPLTDMLPVVILTSSKDRKDIESAFRFHTNAYVQKPVDFNEFIKTCESLSNFWLNSNLNFYNASEF